MDRVLNTKYAMERMHIAQFGLTLLMMLFNFPIRTNILDTWPSSGCRFVHYSL